MEYVLTAEQMNACDIKAQTDYHIDPLVLMERAALETARIIVEKFGTDISVGVVCGSGNNGGDGIALARILREYGVHTQIHMLGEEAKCTTSTKRQLESARAMEIPISYVLDQTLYDVIVDAMFGIGLSRPLQGKFKEACDLINLSKAKVVALDMPSGVDSDDGQVYETTIKADITVTYGFRKIGQMLYPGCTYVGELICVPIGIPDEAFNKKTGIVTFDRSDLHLPSRDPSGNKGTFGKVLVIAGSKSMGGACLLSTLSAYRIGAGMVRIFTADDNKEALLKRIPEVIIDTYIDDGLYNLLPEEENALLKAIDWADVVAIGPGMSLSKKARYVMLTAVKSNRNPMVIDADALNILSEEPELLGLFETQKGLLPYEVIMTPHLGEFARLIKHPVPDIQKDLLGYCKAFARKYNITLVCKDAKTFVSKKYKLTYLNNSGNDGMATAGSGDVLTGIIAGLIAQGMEPYEAAVMGTYVHGLAGDIAKEKSKNYYVMAQDIINSLKYL